MAIRYYIDPATGLPHIYDHGVTESEVEYILRHPDEDRSAREGSRHALGRTFGGRYLRIIYVPDEGGDGIFVVTAYELRGKPLQAFRRRKRR